MPGKQPRVRFEIKKAYTELSGPVGGELRRERIADADVPCPRCGGHDWLLIERRAEPEEPFTRWRALACATCGASDGWESAGRARPGRSAERSGEWDDEAAPGMPEDPRVDDVCRLARFRVLAPGLSAELRSYSHMAGRVTSVTLASGGVEVTTEIRPRILYSLPAEVESQPEDRARTRLRELVVNRDAVLRQPRSAPARALHMDAAHRRAEAHAAAARAGEAMVEVDGAPVPFARVEHEGCWVAVADIGDEAVTIAARHVPTGELALQTVLCD